MLDYIISWFKAFRISWNLARTARRVLADPDANAAAVLNAMVIKAALDERRPVCVHCLKPYTPHPREFGDRFHFRSILMIPDKDPDPMVCDSCFETAITAFNRNATNIGTNNSGHDNLALRYLNGK